MITTEKAREILGMKAKHLTDKQIGIILGSLYRLAEVVVDQVVSMTPTQQKHMIKESVRRSDEG